MYFCWHFWKQSLPDPIPDPRFRKQLRGWGTVRSHSHSRLFFTCGTIKWREPETETILSCCHSLTTHALNQKGVGSLPHCPTSSGTPQPDRRGLHSGWTGLSDTCTYTFSTSELQTIQGLLSSRILTYSLPVYSGSKLSFFFNVFNPFVPLKDGAGVQATCWSVRPFLEKSVWYFG